MLLSPYPVPDTYIEVFFPKKQNKAKQTNNKKQNITFRGKEVTCRLPKCSGKEYLGQREEGDSRYTLIVLVKVRSTQFQASLGVITVVLDKFSLTR